MRISVVGAGYVGLVSGACLVELGHEVACVDVDKDRIRRLQQGEIPIYEPGLPQLVARGLQSGRLSFTADLSEALEGAEVAFIAVGTPPRLRDGEADLSHVYSAASDIIRNAGGPLVIVTKSTVPVGTGDAVELLVRKQQPDFPISVVSNPEFLREGTATEDFLKPDRIVIGANDVQDFATMRRVYAGQIEKGVPFLQTARRTAELIKYAANAFLAVKISFANEIADLCEQVGSDVGEVAQGMGYDRRIGRDFLKAGPGYGGSCFPKDTLALLRTAQDYGVSLRIVQETVGVNDSRKRRMGRRVIDALGGDVQGKKIAILGLAFKAETDDIRESPAIPLIESLQRAGALISAYDPHAMSNARRVLDDVAFCEDALSCVHQAHAAVLVTDWHELSSIDIDAVGRLMKSKVLVDLRNVFDAATAERLGFHYVPIGRPGRLPEYASRGSKTAGANLQSKTNLGSPAGAKTSVHGDRQ